MNQLDVVVMLHSHLPYVLNHGRWPHGSDWICEAAIDTYLPLVEKFRALDALNIAAPVTVGFTPILANQLEHPTFAKELEDYFEQRLGFCDEAPASLESTSDSHLLPLVEYWRSRLVRLRLLFHEVGRDLPREFRRLQDEERLEITSSAATHGFLPMLKRDESIRFQLALGAAEHRRVFGRVAEGCWVPECAYRPAGPWAPLGGVPVDRTGIENHLAWAGFRYFFVDSHMARAGRPLGIYGEFFGGEAARRALAANGGEYVASRTPYEAYRVTDATAAREVAAFVRDPRSSAQVWSRHGGYPGAAPYLEFHKIRWPGGLKLWRVSPKGTDLGDKEPYEPEAARRQATDHATHFVHLLDQLRESQGTKGGDVVVAPFDTELFGHWWFEGPDFLGDLYAQLPDFTSLRACTAGGHLDAHTPLSGLRLAEGSWGANGDFSMWNGPLVEWTWPIIWNVEDRFWSLAPRAIADPRTHEILAQAGRSMLLLQSSDWQFIISTGEVADYAIRRFNGHAEDCDQLLTALEEALAGRDVDGGVKLARELQQRDDVFREIIPSIQAAISDQRTATRVNDRWLSTDR
jgi:1,4-alpha-glucan branching enzyme